MTDIISDRIEDEPIIEPENIEEEIVPEIDNSDEVEEIPETNEEEEEIPEDEVIGEDIEEEIPEIEEEVPESIDENINNLLDSEDENIDEEEENVEDLYAPDTSINDLQSSFESIKIDVKKEDLKEIEKQVKSTSAGKDETEQLYDEFSAFLEQKADIKVDKVRKQFLPTGIDILDAALGGGLVVGGLSIIVGSPGSGKSMLAIQTLANAQKIFQKDLISAFLDSEEATTPIRLSNLGVRSPKIRPYSDVTIEKVFKFLEGLCLFKELKKMTDNPSLVIWDSIANTLSQKEREAEDLNSVIGYKARLLSFLLPKYIQKCSNYNIAFVAINQLRDVLNMGRFTPARDLKFMTHTKEMPGGNSLKFNAFQLLEMKVKTALTEDKNGLDGIVATVKTVKNKFFAPNIEVEIVGTFIRGFSNFWTNYFFLVKNKMIKAASWSSLVDLPDVKFRPRNAENLYNTNPIFKEHFDNNVKIAIKEFLSKYEIVD